MPRLQFMSWRDRAIGAALLGVATLAPAAAFKATLLVPAGDERLDRTRVERAYFGHPTGPASDGVQVALKEARLELESAGASLAVETVEVGSAAEARAGRAAGGRSRPSTTRSHASTRRRRAGATSPSPRDGVAAAPPAGPGPGSRRRPAGGPGRTGPTTLR